MKHVSFFFRVIYPWLLAGYYLWLSMSRGHELAKLYDDYARHLKSDVVSKYKLKPGDTLNFDKYRFRVLTDTTVVIETIEEENDILKPKT